MSNDSAIIMVDGDAVTVEMIAPTIARVVESGPGCEVSPGDIIRLSHEPTGHQPLPQLVEILYPEVDAEEDETDEDSTTDEVPDFDSYDLKPITIPFFIGTDGEIRPFEGFCRGEGAILPGMSPWQTTIGVFTAEGHYSMILIDTRVRCAVPQFWIEKETFHFPILGFLTSGAMVDPETGTLKT
jgi:hypothetical protein